MWWALVLGGLAFARAPDIAHDVTCKGCLAAGVDAGAAQPLVVVLHGDEGSPSKVAELWAPLAERGICKHADGQPGLCTATPSPGEEQRRMWVFAPKCPKEEGCAGSYWRWAGSAAWLFARVDEFSVSHAVDPKRVYLAGWSGGATYIAMMSPDWFPRFAALSLAGGGTHPARDVCLPHAGGACAPVTYLMGSGNPLFALAEQAKSAYERCGHELDWRLLPGADHKAEWRAYQRNVVDIAWWLLARSEGCASPAVVTPLAPAPSAPLAPAASSPHAASVPAVPEARPEVLPRAGCACQLGAERAPGGFSLELLAACYVLRWTRSGARRVERRLADSRRPRPRRA